ncbi:hypothetical protein ASD19_08525 [Microbacterium sp. Root53]|uniref:DUF4012 domain-containing protein n=1 Tax=Microbacterium sp. Root53 TaxID=1736553 RepID=UPI0006FC3F4B|nr:DUF4012 domain-containing protein [Microbacterium sp. Root53]KQY96971.1 hypothetical protein ASD19_08525 [Microbacterium sp. Root53]
MDARKPSAAALTDAAARRRRRRRAVVRVATWGGALLAAAIMLLGVRALLAYGEASALLRTAERLEAAVAAEPLDHAAVAAEADELAAHAAALAAHTADPVWRAAELAPFAGPTLSAVRVAADALDEVAARGVRPGADAAAGFAEALRLDGERIDVGATRALADVAAEARRAVDEARRELAEVDTPAVLEPVRRMLARVDGALERAQPMLAALEPVSALAASTIGSAEPRLILVIVQNNAELRAGGGITGTFLAIEAHEGALELVGNSDSSAFAVADHPVVPLGDAPGGPTTGRFVQNLTMTPDFTLSARLAAEWWRLEKGERPDAVVSIDPVVLQALLEVIGPFELAGERIDAAGILDALLRRPYLTLSQDEQTGYFRDVVAAATEAVLAARSQLPRFAAVLGPLAQEGRVSAWSADPDEQRLIAATPAAGMLARLDQADGQGAHGFGLLLDNLSGSKLDAYLEASFSARASCRPDGRAAVTLAATIRSAVPAEVDFPFTAAPGFSGFARDELGLRVTAIAPEGAAVEGVWRDGAAVHSDAGAAHGRPAVGTRVAVPPGETTTIEFRVVAAEPGGAVPVLIHTPLAGDAPVEVEPAECGGEGAP